MSQLFDLNVNNYSLRELLDFFGLSQNNDAAEVDRKCANLKHKINKDPKLGPVTKGKIHDFLSRATQRLAQTRHTAAEFFNNPNGGATSNGASNGQQLTAAFEAAMKATAPAPAPSKFMDMKNDVEQHGDAFLITRPSQQVGIAANFKNGKAALTGAPPGILNPVAISTIKRALNVDTRFRTNYYATKSTDFVFNIPYKFENVVNMSMATYELPLTYYAMPS